MADTNIIKYQEKQKKKKTNENLEYKFTFTIHNWHSWCFFWCSWCFFGVVGVFLCIWCIFGVFGVFLVYLVFFWRIWCFALRTCLLFGVLGVWFGVFGILSSLKMGRFLLINFAESSLYCVFCGKRYTGWKKVQYRRWCGGGLISGMGANKLYTCEGG